MKPRIVILSAFLTPFRSGAEACAEEVPRVLCDRYDCTIITARLRKDLPSEEIWKNEQGEIKIVRIGSGNFFWDKWLYPFRAAKEAAKHHPDIIHAILETFAGLALKRCKKTDPRAKRMLTCQTTNSSFLKGSIIRSADQVTVISTHLKEIAEQAGARDVALISNGIDLESLEQAVKQHLKVPGRVLFVGRLETMKGVDTLLRAFAVLTKKRQGVHLRIVGDGSQASILEQFSRLLGMADRVTFVGHVASDQIAAEYAQAEVFCGLSRSEGLGNVFLEAQAAGCAVVATRVGGIPDIVLDGQTGLLVPPNDAEAAAEALRRVLNDSDLRMRLATAASAHAKRYDWSAIAAQYAAVYAALLQH